MWRFLVISFVALILVGCSRPTPPPASIPERVTEDSVRLGTWNVRNLFDAIDDPYDDPVLTPDEYERKLTELAEVVESLEADFLALQEVENIGALRDLNERLRTPYPHLGLVEGNDHFRGIDVCFLSRLPVSDVISHKDLVLPEEPGVPEGYKFSRDCLQVDLATRPPTSVLVNHFKSGMGDAKGSAQKRRAQALGVLEIAKQISDSGRLVVVLGDFNDGADSWALSPLFESLTDPLSGVPVEKRITYRYQKVGSALDHILLDAKGAEFVRSARIWGELGGKTSDHHPVTVELYLEVPEWPTEGRQWDEG